MIDGNNELENHIYYVCLINVILFLIGVFADVCQAKSKKLTSKTQKSDEMFQQNETLITFFELSRIFETYFLQL